ncbi:NADH-ubiquinone oxidoreductase B12 subunit family protein [Trichostrongylus colubriformis]|uniref:NADH dehydrogenase [ubiquinone] 1 beta subcomplex subunit 3 n=1 Tax=Trichostrongylus colubriformis TaxID=6319 RepID=A0AAN8F5R1_TRICO
MGHGHHEPFKIPHYSIYNNYRDFPELAAHEKRLAQIGLKDNWIRNHVYLFDREMPHVRGQWNHFKRLILPGWKIGVGLAAAMIAVEEGYLYYKYGKTSWDAHH